MMTKRTTLIDAFHMAQQHPTKLVAMVISAGRRSPTSPTYLRFHR